MTRKTRALLNAMLGLIDDVINHLCNDYPDAQDVFQRAEELEDAINAHLRRRDLWPRLRAVARRVRWAIVRRLSPRERRLARAQRAVSELINGPGCGANGEG